MPVDFQEQEALDAAASVLNRLRSDSLNCYPIPSGKLPSSSGVYFATTPNRSILYIGKANNFASRCNPAKHRKLLSAINQGAAFLFTAPVRSSIAWYVEQKLISELNPPLNEECNRWWLKKSETQSRQDKGHAIRYVRSNTDLLVLDRKCFRDSKISLTAKGAYGVLVDADYEVDVIDSPEWDAAIAELLSAGYISVETDENGEDTIVV